MTEMMPEFDLTGRVAIVTGGNGGIGRGIALGLARAGADVAILARNEEKTAVVVDEISALGRRELGVRCDVSDDDDVWNAIDRTRAELGGISIVVNNAAISLPSDNGPEPWDQMFATNVRAPYVVATMAHGALVAAGGGKVINISSGAGIIGFELSPAYAASKAALLNLTMTLAVKWGGDNIQVNCILPGAFHTDMSPNLHVPVVGDWWKERTPAGRHGQPEEFAGIAVFLASRASDFMTGQCIAFDGGVTLPSLIRPGDRR
jgi:2-deoxy-D-gluconate 3-dehydrogenase